MVNNRLKRVLEIPYGYKISQSKETMSRVFKREAANAKNYRDWKEAALAYDERRGLEQWKQVDKSRRYDYTYIRARLEQLRILRRSKDDPGLMFNLNEGIHGNLSGMGRPALYQKAKFGTKQLIVDYVEEIASALEHLAKPNLKGISAQERIEFFHRAHLCFGQSALLFSGSGTYLFFHIGVLKALWQEDLIPSVVSGSSGGALIAAAAGTRPNDQLGEIFDSKFLSFEEEISAILSSIGRGRRKKLPQHYLQNIIDRVVPDVTFAEAYQISGLKINISIAPAEKHQKARLLNAITSPNVLVRDAVLASCSIPGVFAPTALAARDINGERVPYLPGRKWIDGSLSDDLPMKRLARLYGINHFIVSQTNPMVLPFIGAEKGGQSVLGMLSQTVLKSAKDWGVAASRILRQPFSQDSYPSRALDGYISILSQTYTGDINILPSGRFLNPAKALSARSTEEVMQMVSEGERSTWPMMERIRIQTHISRTLNRLLEDLDQSMFKINRTVVLPKRIAVNKKTKHAPESKKKRPTKKLAK